MNKYRAQDVLTSYLFGLTNLKEDYPKDRALVFKGIIERTMKEYSDDGKLKSIGEYAVECLKRYCKEKNERFKAITRNMAIMYCRKFLSRVKKIEK